MVYRAISLFATEVKEKREPGHCGKVFDDLVRGVGTDFEAF